MPDLDLTQARQLLDRFSCTETRAVTSEAERQQLQAALLRLASESESENLGVCATTWAEALQATSQYLQALGYSVPPALSQESPAPGPLYLKFNTAKQTYFIDTYSGEYRGVLVACQAEDEAIAGVYGHLPLDLFADIPAQA